MTLFITYVLLCLHVFRKGTRTGSGEEAPGTTILLQSPVFVPGGQPGPGDDRATTMALVLSRAYCWLAMGTVLLYSRARPHLILVSILGALALCQALLMLSIDPTRNSKTPALRYLAVACLIGAYGVSVLGLYTLGNQHASVVNCAVLTICSCLGVDAAVSITRV